VNTVPLGVVRAWKAGGEVLQAITAVQVEMRDAFDRAMVPTGQVVLDLTIDGQLFNVTFVVVPGNGGVEGNIILGTGFLEAQGGFTVDYNTGRVSTHSGLVMQLMEPGVAIVPDTVGACTMAAVTVHRGSQERGGRAARGGSGAAGIVRMAVGDGTGGSLREGGGGGTGGDIADPDGGGAHGIGSGAAGRGAVASAGRDIGGGGYRRVGRRDTGGGGAGQRPDGRHCGRGSTDRAEGRHAGHGERRYGGDAEADEAVAAAGQC